MQFKDVKIGRRFAFNYNVGGVAPGISPPGSISHPVNQSDTCTKLSDTLYRAVNDPSLTEHYAQPHEEVVCRDYETELYN